ERPGHTAAVAQFPENGPTLLVERPRPGMVPLDLGEVGEVAERARDRGAVSELSPQGQAFLEGRPSRFEVASIPGKNRHGIQREGLTRLLPHLPFNVQALA